MKQDKFEKNKDSSKSTGWNPKFEHYDGKTTWRDSRGRLVVAYDAFSDVDYCGICDEPLYSECKCR